MGGVFAADRCILTAENYPQRTDLEPMGGTEPSQVPSGVRTLSIIRSVLLLTLLLQKQ